MQGYYEGKGAVNSGFFEQLATEYGIEDGANDAGMTKDDAYNLINKVLGMYYNALGKKAGFDSPTAKELRDEMKDVGFKFDDNNRITNKNGTDGVQKCHVNWFEGIFNWNRDWDDIDDEVSNSLDKLKN